MITDRIPTITLDAMSNITKIAYRTLYERYKAGTLKGYSQGGIIYIYTAQRCEYLNYILNFDKNKTANVKIDFCMEEKRDTSELHKNGFYVNYDSLIPFLDELSKIEIFQDKSAIITLHFAPDEDKRLFYITFIRVDDKLEIPARTYDSQYLPLLERQKNIDNSIENILKKYAKNSHYFSISPGSGGVLTLNDGHIKAWQAYFLFS